MNTSQSFMDKQIMDLSNSQSSNDFPDLMNHHPQEEDHHASDGGGGSGSGGSKKEEILPNYDFQPIRPLGTSPSPPQINQNHHHQNSGSVGTVEPVKVISEKDRDIYDAALLSEIERTMKKHTDNLLHALEGVSARLSQLETRSRHLENSVDDLKVSAGNNHGSTDGKMRQIENVLREVQAGVQVVKEKQEILEAQMHFSKLQLSKTQHQTESQITGHMDAVHQVGSAPIQQVASAPMQSHLQPPPAPHNTHTPPIFPPPNGSPQNLPPPPPSQFPQNQIPPLPQHDPYFLPPGHSQSQSQENPNQQYQVPPPQQIPIPLPPQPQTQPLPQYQPQPPPQYSQPPPPPPQQYPSQPQHSEEPPYMPSQSYPPSVHQSGGAPSQQFYSGAPPMMYEPPPQPPQSSRPNSGFSYGLSENFSYGGPQPQYNVGSPRKSQQISPPNMGPSSGSGGYPQLPTARILPQALPTASGVGGGGGGGGNNRVPIDDVVDKVTSMGFSREQVRAAVRKLTENGQSVDLNVVLDKVMNDGGEGGPQRGWFGR